MDDLDSPLYSQLYKFKRLPIAQPRSRFNIKNMDYNFKSEEIETECGQKFYRLNLNDCVLIALFQGYVAVLYLKKATKWFKSNDEKRINKFKIYKKALIEAFETFFPENGNKKQVQKLLGIDLIKIEHLVFHFLQKKVKDKDLKKVNEEVEKSLGSTMSDESSDLSLSSNNYLPVNLIK